MQASYVYFICEHGDVRTFKIGESIHPEQRMKNLQTGNKRFLQVYRIIACPDKHYAKKLEETLHEAYQSRRISGEWFNISCEEVNIICATVEMMIVENLPVELFQEILRNLSRPALGPLGTKPVKKEATKTYGIPFIQMNVSA